MTVRKASHHCSGKSAPLSQAVPGGGPQHRLNKASKEAPPPAGPWQAQLPSCPKATHTLLAGLLHTHSHPPREKLRDEPQAEEDWPQYHPEERRSVSQSLQGLSEVEWGHHHGINSTSNIKPLLIILTVYNLNFFLPDFKNQYGISEYKKHPHALKYST